MDSGKVVLVTGTSSGFGRLIAQTVARKRYTVFASMREPTGRNAEASAALRTAAQREGLPLQVLELDVTRDASVARAVREVIKQAGRIDVLVNNAGFGYLGLTETFTLAQAQRIFATNFFGAVRVNRAVLPQMRRQGSGLLIHITSIGGRLVCPALGLYCASKFALEALAETYRYELSQLGIDSVIVEPGTYPTSILAKLEQPGDPTRAIEYGPMAEIPGKVLAALRASQADPQEVTDAIVELIETPAGKRPLRRLIGQDAQGLQPLNDVAAQIQRGIMEAFGMGELMSLRPPHNREA